MTDLAERLRSLEQNPAPDMWDEIEARARHGSSAAPRSSLSHRWTAGLVAAAIGVAAIVLVAVAFRPSQTEDQGIGVLAPAPRDCPTGLVRSNPITVGQFQAAARGHLPGWLPPGFGLLRTYGAESRTADGSGAYGIWSDEHCREVEMTFDPSARPPGTSYHPSVTRVGPWSLTADVPNGCFNVVLGKSRCLDYVAVADDGIISLAMMGLDREEGDRIALSILGPSVPIPNLGATPQDGTGLLGAFAVLPCECRG